LIKALWNIVARMAGQSCDNESAALANLAVYDQPPSRRQAGELTPLDHLLQWLDSRDPIRAANQLNFATNVQ
jgi:hypothetical protein